MQLPESELSIPGGTFVDAYIVRVLGAALLALAFSSFLCRRASQWGEVALVVELETAFCLLALLGVITNLVTVSRSMPSFGWLVLAFLVVFAAAWGWAWRDHAGG